ncbi:hypothetical protein GH5_07231 [Leishmania sp. Ghana 2012 LV757]|uniref:hypothetical protein n=1 Tax=Leishmania sp. Ghana 2012 LV757 TaxID=2803181 RepID=UPI001B3FAA41|nr:hypothetical protein GH5_07231 [Leishmania sp. Ghana 2012 LV757]
MASYWWPLGRSFVPEQTKGPESTGAPTATHSSLPVALSERTAMATGAHNNTAAAAVADVRHLAHAAFHTSLEGLLVESTKHRSLFLLRDAVQDTRQRQYDPTSLFETLCIACILLAERSAGGIGTTTRRSSSSAAQPPTTPGPTTGGTASSSSGTGLYATSSCSEVAHAPVTAAEAASPPASGARASFAASPPHALHYRHHAASRALLLQSIGDIGKLIALALLPVTQQVGKRVADLVRQLAFQPSLLQPAQHPSSCSQLPARAAAPLSVQTASTPMTLPLAPPSHAAASRDKVPSSGVADINSSGGAMPSTAATATVSVAGPVQLVHDDPVLVRLIQMTASAASRCPLGSSALAELYGVLFLFYNGVAPQSVLEATCEATLTHHIHTVLTALHDSGTGDDDGVASASGHANGDGPLHHSSPSVTPPASTFTAQLQGVAFIKDVCRLMIGARTRWLYLSPYCSTPSAPGSAAGGGRNVTAASGSNYSKKGAAVQHKVNIPSSMAGITASVAAATGDGGLLWGHDQQQHSSLTSTPMLKSLATSSPLTQNVLNAQSAAAATVAVSGASDLAHAAELPSLSSLPLTVPLCATMEAAPDRLRLFLVRTVTLFFKEYAKALMLPTEATAVTGEVEGANGSTTVTSAAAVAMRSPLYTQCLNDCLFSVALWGLHEMGITVPMQPPPTLFVEMLQQQQQQHRDGSFSAQSCSLELFTCTQQLALASISTHLPSMTNSAQVLLEAHERLLHQLCRRCKPCATSLSSPCFGRNDEVSGGARVSGDDAERLSQAAAVVLSLWRKTLTSASLLWKLLQLRSMRSGRRDDSKADAVAAGMSKSAEAYRNSGLYSEEEWWAGRRMNENSYSSDNDDGGGSSTVGASQRWLQSPHDGPAYQQLPALALPRSRGSYLTGSQTAPGGCCDSENNRVRTPAPPGITDTAVVSDQGGTGVDDTSVPSLVRLILSLVELVVSHMQSHATTTMQVSAGDRITDDRCGGGDGEEAENVSLTGPLLLTSTPPRLLSAEDARDGALSELSLKRSPLDIGLATVTEVGPAAAAAPVCVCTTNASTAYQCFTEVLNCLTAFGQLFSQLVDTQLMPSAAAADKEQVLCRCRACFLALHPRLLHCEQLCLRHLRYEEDVLPVVLKATGYWVQVSCVLQLPEERDSYLAALVDVLRTPDPVAGYLVALAPPTALCMSDVTSHTTAMLLKALLKLNNECMATDPVVPGSVAAAALSLSDECDSASPGSKGDAKRSLQNALNMSSWGAGWLGRGRTTSSSTRDSTAARGRTSGRGSWATSPLQAQVNTTSTSERGGAGARSSIAGPSPRIGTPPLLASPSRSKQQPAPASSAMPSALTSRGWRAPAMQHAVILGVCRLQHKVFIMKTLHVIANTLGAQLKTGWALLARGLAVTEPLLHMLKRLLSWIEESAEEHEQQEQLLSDALHLRDALRSLCVHNACQLPYAQFDIFFAEFVNGTVAVGEAAPYAAASGQLPYQDPQGYGDQWVLTSECLSVSVFAMLPFVERRYTDTVAGMTAEEERDSSGGANRSGVQATSLQHQRTGALARALRLWELETLLFRYITDPRHVVEWGTKLLTAMAAHKRALLAATASSSAEPAATDPGEPLVNGSLSHEETRRIELVLSTVVGHVATVAVQLCRSASRRRVAAMSSVDGVGGAGSAASRHAPSTVAPSSSYQALQSASLVLTSGPFATVPLTQVSNALFAANAALSSSLVSSSAKDSLASVGGGCRLPFLPFVQADATQSISGLLAAVHRSMQAIAVHSYLDDSNSSVATAPSATAPVNLDPLEQLLASPFALLDSVYHEWQRQWAGWPSRCEEAGLSTATNAAEPRELEDRLSLAPAGSDKARQQWHRGERSACLGALEASAASSVVAATLPKLLANTAATVLMVVVKIVQSYGEDIDGAAWEAILSLLQRTAMVTKGYGSLLVNTRGGGAGGGGGVTQSSANNNNNADGRSASSIGSPRDTSGIKAPSTAFSTEAVESLNTAFRALESIQHNHIPRLKADGLHRLILCVGTFTVHRVDGGAPGERKLHTNLSAVQLLWSIADYLAAFGGEALEELERSRVDDNGKESSVGIVNVTTSGYAGAAAGGMPGSPTQYSNSSSAAQQQQDRLWCALLWQLRSGCLDDRQEVRQSSLQTFFALVQTYGWRFSAVCWQCALQDVLMPLMEAVEVATTLCATPSPSASPSVPGEDGGAVLTAAAAAGTGAQDATMQRLLRSFADHPPQLEEVRVALFDAGSRLFVTHYAHMQAAATALSAFSSAQPQHPPLPVTGEDKNDATQALERFLRLCGDVCMVLQGTTGEQAAVAAVHALHGLLVEMPGKGLHAHGVHLAWCALERLLLCGGGDDCADGSPADWREGTLPAPYAHTRAKQCTIAVMAATVAAICDSFRLQRLVAAAAPDAADGSTTVTSPSTVEHTHSATGLSSYFSGWGGGGGAGIVSATGAMSGADLRLRGSSSPTQYFTRLLFLLQAVTRCSAVVNSYYFPSKAQSTLLEGVTAVWPTLSSREAQMVWAEVLLPAFPPAAQLQSFVLQQPHECVPTTVINTTTTNAAAAAAAASTLISLRSAMPPGSHPGYLSAVMETMRGLMLYHIGTDTVSAPAAATPTSAKMTDEDCVRLAFMAPSALQAIGTLLLLHLAPVAALGGPSRSGSVPFTLPTLFLQECTDLMLYTLWGPILARATAPPSPPSLSGPSASTVSAPTAATVQCRRDGVTALCRVFELLLVTTSTVVRRLDATSRSGAAATSGATTPPTTSIMPPHVTAALQSLDLLVDTLGEVVHCVMEQYEDVVCATAAITALSLASTAEGVALSQVARRSLSLLQRWADAVAATPSVRLPSPSSAETQHHHTRSCSDGSRVMSPDAQHADARHNVHAQPHSAGDAAATTALTETSRSKLQNVVRASMESRNKAIIAQFVDNPDDTSAGELLIGTLRDMLNGAQNFARAGPRVGGGAAMQSLSIMMPELLRLVACSSREPNRSVAMITQEQEMRGLLTDLLAIALNEEKQLPNQSGSHEKRSRQEDDHPLRSNAGNWH